MVEQSIQRHFDNRPVPEVLYLPDLLDSKQQCSASEYLSLSLTQFGEHTRISITTTDNNPITYTTIIAATTCVDFQTLCFFLHR